MTHRSTVKKILQIVIDIQQHRKRWWCLKKLPKMTQTWNIGCLSLINNLNAFCKHIQNFNGISFYWNVGKLPVPKHLNVHSTLLFTYNCMNLKLSNFSHLISSSNSPLSAMHCYSSSQSPWSSLCCHSSSLHCRSSLCGLFHSTVHSPEVHFHRSLFCPLLSLNETSPRVVRFTEVSFIVTALSLVASLTH